MLALATQRDRDAMHAVFEALPDTLRDSVLLALSHHDDSALFAIGLSALIDPAPWALRVREHSTEEHLRATLSVVLQGTSRDSSRVRAMFELVALGSHPDTIRAVTDCLTDEIHGVRTAAVRALASLGAWDGLLSALRSPHRALRADARALLAASLSREPSLRERVTQTLFTIEHTDSSEFERFEARNMIRALGGLAPLSAWTRVHQDAADALAHELETHANRVTIARACEVLADTEDPRAIASVRAALAHRSRVQRVLLAFRPFFKGPVGGHAMLVLSRDSDSLVRERVEALRPFCRA